MIFYVILKNKTLANNVNKSSKTITLKVNEWNSRVWRI